MFIHLKKKKTPKIEAIAFMSLWNLPVFIDSPITFFFLSYIYMCVGIVTVSVCVVIFTVSVLSP